MKYSTPLFCALALVLVCSGATAVWAENNDGPARDPERAAKSWRTPLVIPAADFRPDGSHPEDFFFHPSGIIQGDGTPLHIFAPVYLPNGATVKQLTARVYDNSTTCSEPDMQVFLRRTRLDIGSYSSMAYAATSGASGWPQEISDTTISNAQIDNWNYSYFVFVSLCSSVHELSAINIYYTE